MRLPTARRVGWLSVGLGLIAAGAACAEAAGRVPSRAARVRPGVQVPVPVLVPVQPRLTGEPSSYDPCLVSAPDVDPRFVVPARPVDEAMIVAPRVAGMYVGTLAPRH